MQVYSDIERESETFALPNVEVWHVPPGDHRTRRLYFETCTARVSMVCNLVGTGGHAPQDAYRIAKPSAHSLQKQKL